MKTPSNDSSPCAGRRAPVRRWQKTVPHFSRRALLQGTTLWMCGPGRPSFADQKLPSVASQPDLPSTDSPPAAWRVALVTDLHHADKEPAGSRHYRETVSKLGEAVTYFNEQHVDLAFELGDLIDSADSVDDELRTLDTIQAEWSQLKCPRHYVLGNHCVHTLQKEEFLARTSKRPSFYSFDHATHHLIVLDACFRHDEQPYGRMNFVWHDANLPQAQRDWLRNDLKKTDKPTLVFIHQRLDRDPPDHYAVKQSPAVRQILEASKKVVAVFQGHSHQNDHRDINGIHYCTLRAMVEGSGEANSGYSLLDVLPNGTLRIHGFRQQADYQWTT